MKAFPHSEGDHEQKFLINYGELFGKIVPGRGKLIQCPLRVFGLSCISCWRLAKGECLSVPRTDRVYRLLKCKSKANCHGDLSGKH